MKATAVDNSFECYPCALQVTRQCCRFFYNSRRHGRKDGRLGAEPDQLVTKSRLERIWAALFLQVNDEQSETTKRQNAQPAASRLPRQHRPHLGNS